MSFVESDSEEEEEITWIFSNSYSSSQKLDIRNHSRSLLRFSYRSHFPALAPYTYTNDAGWGCMHRSAQMLIGQTMQRHYLGREWRMPNTTEMLRSDKDYCNIVRWCTDYPGPSCIYAIHHIIQCGMVYDKLPGEWYGPSTASLALRDLTRLHRRKYRGPVEAHVTSGDTIYITEVEKTFTAIKSDEIDPFCDEDDEGDDHFSSRRRIKNKNRRSSSGKKKNSTSSNSNTKKSSTSTSKKKSGSSRREEANQRISVERSEDSVSSSLASHSQDLLEDEVNSFTHSVPSDSSSQCRSRTQSLESLVSLDGDDEEGRNEDLNEPDGLLAGLSLESNPFILHSHSSQSEGEEEGNTCTNKSSSVHPLPYSSESMLSLTPEDSPFLSHSSDGESLLSPSPQGKQQTKDETEVQGNKNSHSPDKDKDKEKVFIHDPLFNPPPSLKEEEWPASLLLLLPLRLGLDKFNPLYIPALKEFLRHRNSVGILGGQVNRAIYFVGYRGDTLLGMDPHTVYKNPPLTPPFPSMEHIEQIHRNDLHELSFNLLDPSLALAFYFHDRYEFKAFCDETKFHNEQSLKTGKMSLYNVQHAPAAMQFNMDLSGMCNSDSDDGCSDDSDFEDEEYVFI